MRVCISLTFHFSVLIHNGDTDDETDRAKLAKENICYKCGAGFDKRTNLSLEII